jgi:hypothetical protein
MLHYAAVKCGIVVRFRFHSRHLGEECRKDFRRLSEKVANETVTGEEQYRHVFRRETPPDVVGAVALVEVNS